METEVRTRPQRKRESPKFREMFETDDEQEDEDQDEVEEDSDSEDLAPKRRRRGNDGGRAKKRAKGSVPPRLPLAVSKGRGTGRKRKKPDAEDVSGSSLFEIVKSNGEAVQEAAREWLVRYETDRDAAVTELLTMLFQACGSRYVMEDAGTDVDEAVETMVAQAKMGNLDDSIGSKKGDVRNFKSNLEAFWEALVLECQEVALFDQYLMDKVMDFVIAISCTPPRNFRHVATLVGLQLVSAFVTLANTLCRARETKQRQLNAERKRNKGGPMLAEALAKSLSETHERITQVEEMMRKIFTGLFMHRYRDKDENIRVACVSSIGSWIASYPSLFLQELYLKYLGFPLNDKRPNVRNSAILALQALYAVDAYVPSLALFSTRFCSRMVELADDIEVSVAVNAIGLLKLLFKHQLVPDEYLGSLFDLLIDDQAQIRHAVGDLVYEHLVIQNPSLDPKALEEPVEAELDRILQILREFSADPILSDYVIDAFWDKSKAMKDWKCLLSMLLDEKPRIELADGDATNLIRVLLASAKKSVGEKIVPSVEVRTTDHRKSAMNKAQKEALEAAKAEMTSALMKAYPKLLRKFLVDRGKVAAIAEVLLYMDLQLFSLKRKEQEYTSALHLLKDAFLKHGDEETLRACIKALSFAITDSHADLLDTAQQVVSETVDDLTVKLRHAISHAGETEDEYSLIANLRRMHHMLLAVPVTNESLFTEMLGLIKDFNYLDDEVIRLVLLNMFLQVAWLLKSIDADRPDEAAIQTLIARRSSLLEQLRCFGDSVYDSWESGSPRSPLSSTICVILSDVWSLFSEEKLAPTRLHKLGISPDDDFLRHFWNLCQHKLFANDDAEEAAEDHSEYLDEKVVVMSAAAKLVANKLIPTDFLGPEIVSHLVLHDNIVAETVKQLVVFLREQESPEKVSHLYLEAMKRAHRRFLDESDDSWSTKDSYNTCKELALRLSATLKRTAKATILKIVKGGIKHAFVDPPKQLTFLEVGVLQFAAKLTSADLRPIYDLMVSRMQGINTDEDPSGWRPCLVFLQYLKEKCSITDVSADKGSGRRGRRRAAAIKGGKKLFDGQDTSEEENADPISSASGEADEEEEDEDEEHAVLANLKTARTARQRAVKAKSSNKAAAATTAAASTTPTTSEADHQQRSEEPVSHPREDFANTATEEQLPRGPAASEQEQDQTVSNQEEPSSNGDQSADGISPASSGQAHQRPDTWTEERLPGRYTRRRTRSRGEDEGASPGEEASAEKESSLWKETSSAEEPSHGKDTSSGKEASPPASMSAGD